MTTLVKFILLTVLLYVRHNNNNVLSTSFTIRDQCRLLGVAYYPCSLRSAEQRCSLFELIKLLRSRNAICLGEEAIFMK